MIEHPCPIGCTLDVRTGEMVVWTEITTAELKKSDIICGEHAQSLAKCSNIAI